MDELDEDGGPTYAVKKIHADRAGPKGTEYLIEFDGYPDIKDFEWRPTSAFMDKKIINVYNKNKNNTKKASEPGITDAKGKGKGRGKSKGTARA